MGKPLELIAGGRTTAGDRAPLAQPPAGARRLPRRSAKPLADAPGVAARRFIRWMQYWGYTGLMPWGGPGKDGVWEYYLWHCSDEGKTPVHEYELGEAMAKLTERRIVHDRSTGKRRRISHYQIPEGDEAVVLQ